MTQSEVGKWASIDSWYLQSSVGCSLGRAGSWSQRRGCQSRPSWRQLARAGAPRPRWRWYACRGPVADGGLAKGVCLRMLLLAHLQQSRPRYLSMLLRPSVLRGFQHWPDGQHAASCCPVQNLQRLLKTGGKKGRIQLIPPGGDRAWGKAVASAPVARLGAGVAGTARGEGCPACLGAAKAAAPNADAPKGLLEPGCWLVCGCWG